MLCVLLQVVDLSNNQTLQLCGTMSNVTGQYSLGSDVRFEFESDPIDQFGGFRGVYEIEPVSDVGKQNILADITSLVYWKLTLNCTQTVRY